jgi:hypothetical protein
VISPDVDGRSTSCTPSLPLHGPARRADSTMKRVFVGWPLWTPSPEGVRCVLGAEGTLGSEARDVKSKRHALPSGRPRNRPRRPQKPRPEPGCHSWITASSALSVRVLSYLAAQLKDPLRLGGHPSWPRVSLSSGTRHRHRVRDAHGARLAQPAHRRPDHGGGRGDRHRRRDHRRRAGLLPEPGWPPRSPRR